MSRNSGLILFLTILTLTIALTSADISRRNLGAKVTIPHNDVASKSGNTVTHVFAAIVVQIIAIFALM
ncbi:unnamed protein product [Caenorhabditis angaria]|uniref:Uncharacterized protein n=1 Tax=Caenorhabditis angaria TaxID=860376 RepID=A0A9P1IYQ7_9PELO|nr:unnamed protein product [Caenorhabditis angaria]